MKFLLSLLFVLMLLVPASMQASSPLTLVVTATAVHGDGVTSGSPLVVRFDLSTNSEPIAPSAAALRVRFNNNALQWVGATNTPTTTWGDLPSFPAANLGAAVASPADLTDVTSDYRDVATVGTSVFPPVNTVPVCFYVRFMVLEAASTITPYQVTADVLSPTGNHFPYLTLAPPAATSLDLNPDNTGTMTFIPALITNVRDWKTLEQ
jgi:hypothetical protein